MASLTDVENALVNLIAGTLYPNGAAQPSVVGYPVKVYAGWPDSATLDGDLVEFPPNSGKPTAAHVSIYPLPSERNTTRYRATQTAGTPNPATYTITGSGSTITVGGAPPSPYYLHNFAALVDGKPYMVGATSGETPAQIASALQALIVADVPGTTVSGATITVPAGARIGALRVGTEATVTSEVRRQERQFQISVWSSNPTSRAAVADAIDPTLAATPWLTLADGTSGRMIYHGGREDDFTQLQRVWRRSFIYAIEYPTLLTSTASQIVAMEIDRSVTDAAGDVLAGPVKSYV